MLEDAQHMDGCQAGGDRDAPSGTCITEAARFVASDSGAAHRLLAAHVAGPDGRCRACGQRPVAWPCVLVTIARQALRVAR
jgi:hypothetical protein